MVTTSRLQALVRLPAYQESRQHLFPSENSLAWFVRMNRAALVEAGALLMINRTWHVSPDQFDAFLLELGSTTARQRIAVEQNVEVLQ